MDEILLALSSSVGKALVNRGYTISTAESCTGGLLSHVLTGISGASAYFVGGVIAYSNVVKAQVLGIEVATLERYGAVSAQTARQMAESARRKFDTDFGLSTTGIAGPTGGTPEKPVGFVWIGISTPDKTQTHACQFSGERLAIMRSTVIEALTCLLDELGGVEG